MKRDFKFGDVYRPYKLAHQTLCITGFNFERKSLIGYVELLLFPQKQDLRRIKLNSKQCRIYRVVINDGFDADFNYHDPTLEVCQGDGKQRNLDYFESCQSNALTSVDTDQANGELEITLPMEMIGSIMELKPFRCTIEFSLEEPKGGIHFVVPDLDGTMLDRGAHLFTYSHENSSRLWFPCVDNFSEVCTWKLEYTVDMYMTAISCGDLIETVYTTDLRKKTYHYYLATPTAAPNIALAVGPFEVVVDPFMHEVTHFCLPHLKPVLKQSTSFLHEVFEFYEELMSIRYPYTCYKQVFVDQAYDEFSSYATMTIFSTNLLHTKRIIDQVPVSRQLMADAIALQFFGCFISMNSWYDAWLTKGISGYLSGLYRKKAFGNNEYKYFISKELEEVHSFEANMGGITLDPSVFKVVNSYFSTRTAHSMSQKYVNIYEKKAHLVFRMLEIQIGQELLIQAFNKLLALAQNASLQKFTSLTWVNMLLSTSSFLKGLATVTGKDVKTFIEQWAQHPGCARFYCNFVFNRKRNVVELELKPDLSRGALRYVGPLTVVIQELDGTFNHTFKIEENQTKFEITCHSKSRRNKKKKIPLCTGEEVDMDLSATDTDSPVLWLRVDPDMTILREIILEQPDYMWQYMLKYERCVVSQKEAIRALESFPTPATRKALTDTIENENCFYRVRIDACETLSKVANAMVSSWVGPPAMMTIFRKFYGSHSCPEIVRQNNFSNFPQYFVQKVIPVCMAKLRDSHNICLSNVLEFLLDLFKYNDNQRNKYSDNYYRATLIDALAETVTPAVTQVTITGYGPSTDALSKDTKSILDELTRYLNMEKLLPSYRHAVTVSCLATIRRLQKFGHIPPDPSIFKIYASHGHFTDVRLAGLRALVDYVKVDQSYDILNWLLDLVEDDPEPYIKHNLLLLLIENPPFTYMSVESCTLSTESLVERLWKMMNSSFHYDSRLRCDVADLYYTLYGRRRPTCLAIPDNVLVLNMRQKTTRMNVKPGEDMGNIFENDDSDLEDSKDILRNMISFKRESDLPISSGSADYSANFNPAVKLEFNSNQSKVKVWNVKPEPEEEKSLPIDITSVFQITSNDFVSGIPEDYIMKSASEPKISYTSSALPEAQPIFQNADSMSRLSEEGTDSDPSLHGSADKIIGPTEFNESMFAGQSQSCLMTGEEMNRMPKLKKKKKKNKHKHKHKHKSEKNEKDEKSVKIDKHSVGGIILEHRLSSDASNTPSPALPSSPPSSPEFEVI